MDRLVNNNIPNAFQLLSKWKIQSKIGSVGGCRTFHTMNPLQKKNLKKTTGFPLFPLKNLRLYIFFNSSQLSISIGTQYNSDTTKYRNFCHS